MLSTTLLLFWVLVAANRVHSQGLTESIDFQQPPEPCRIIYSPSNSYRILIENKGVLATLSLQVNQKDTWQSLWTEELPHRIGPRYAFVGDLGAIVLVDEWINVFSPVALTVLNVKGNQVAVYSTDEISRFLNIPRKELAHSATVGPWMRGLPFLRQGAEIVTVPMTGQELRVDMNSGKLSIHSIS